MAVEHLTTPKVEIIAYTGLVYPGQRFVCPSPWSDREENVLAAKLHRYRSLEGLLAVEYSIEGFPPIS